MIHSYSHDDSSVSIENVFQRGHALRVLSRDEEQDRITSAMAEIATYLVQFPPTPSFGGIDELDADRQTLWVASTGLRNSFHTEREDVVRFDGDVEGGERGLEALQREVGVRRALEDLKRVLDDALEIAARGIGLDRDLPAELFRKITVRYRAIRYAPVEREVAGIGFHPDGNVLSALLTDQLGLLIKERETVCRPSPEGTVVMPGSILYRWSHGHYKPTFHSVEIRKGEPTKFTIVAFLNYPDQTHVPRRGHGHDSGAFFNDVQRHKEDDMNRSGDLASLWSSLD